MLNFFSSLAGPVFAKEMLEVSRRKRYYVNRVLYAAALLIAVAIVWESSVVARNFQNGGARLQVMARVAEGIFIAVCCVQYGAVFLLVPLFVAGLIAGERESNSLDLLFTTTLRDREIVLGKLGSRLAIMTLLVLCGLPIVNLILLFGGVDPLAVLRAETATLLGMFFAGSVTMYFSTISKSPTAALVRSIWWMAVWLLGVPLVSVMIVEAFNVRPNSSAAIIVWGQALLNPGFLFVIALAPELHQVISGYLGSWFFPAAFVPTIAWSVFLLWRSVVRLRMPPTLIWKLSARWRLLAAGLDRLQKRRTHTDHLRRDGAERLLLGWKVRNPLWLRSRWTPVYDRERHIVRVQRLGCLVATGFLFLVPWDAPGWPPTSGIVVWPAALLLAGLVSVGFWRRMRDRAAAWRITLYLVVAALALPFLYYQPRSWRDEEIALVFLMPTWIAAYLLTVILGATSIVGDRRRGFFELVLISPLEPREIVGGTMVAVAQHLLLVYGLAVALTVWFFLASAMPLVPAICALITGLLFGLLLLQLGVICSLAAERPPAAVLPTFIFGAMMCIGLLIVAALFQELTLPLVMLVSIGGTVGSWLWTRRRLSPAAVGCLFFCVHLGFVFIAGLLGFNASGRSFSIEEEVFLATSPLAKMVELIDLWNSGRYSGAMVWRVLCYWTAVVATLVLAWLWTIRNFDRLAGRACLPIIGLQRGVTALERQAAAPGVILSPDSPLIAAELVADSTATEPS